MEERSIALSVDVFSCRQTDLVGALTALRAAGAEDPPRLFIEPVLVASGRHRGDGRL